jgi:chemotaxis protein methyltransferase CheR
VARAAPPAAWPPLTRVATMSNELFRMFREFIYHLTGIYFQDNKKYLLEGRISKRVQLLGLKSCEDYLQLLKYGSRRAEELAHFYDAITINETFFFRNKPQFDAFEETLVPDILAQRGFLTHQKLRVWSAASSSGEEAHTLAMIYLEKLRRKFKGLELEVIGTDISAAVLERARTAVYREYSIRNMPGDYLDKYFAVQDARYMLHEEVKGCVRFGYLNLIDRTRMRQMANFDVIFCCNALIYFDTRSKIQVISHLYDALNRGGYLFVGHAESLHGISTAFKLVNFAKTVAYKKE